MVPGTTFCILERQNLAFRAPSKVICLQKCSQKLPRTGCVASFVRSFVWLFDCLFACLSGVMVRVLVSVLVSVFACILFVCLVG